MKTLKLSLMIVLILSILFGCKTKDEEAPVITNVQIKDNVVTIEASDNVEVTGYISVSNPRQPSLTDENWQESNTITLNEDGTYYIWVKDSSDNLTQYKETIEMGYNLALKFDHLNWLTPAEGTKVVDGVTYNLAELKAEYGDLYRLVEPLTNEEIESRFEYLARFMELQRGEALKCNCQSWYIEGGLKSSNDLNVEVVKVINDNMRKIEIENDSKLEIFRKYYKYNEFLGRYATSYPITFNSEKGVSGVGTDIISKVSLEDKVFFTRDFMFKYDIILKVYGQLGLKPEYVIENWDWSK